MRKQVRKLSIHRETLRHLDSKELLRAAGADQEAPYTMKLPPTNGAYSCGCPYSTMCDSISVCSGN